MNDNLVPDDLAGIMEKAADFKIGTPLLPSEKALSDAEKLRRQLSPQQRNPLEERIAAAKEINLVNKYQEAAKSFSLMRTLIARRKEDSLTEDHTQNVADLRGYLGDDSVIRAEYSQEELERVSDMFLFYCAQKKRQPFRGTSETAGAGDELRAAVSILGALEVYAAKPPGNEHPVAVLLQQAQARGKTGENIGKEIYALKKMKNTLDVFYPDLS